MGHDIGWKNYLSDDERYADIINGIACKGEQVVRACDLQEVDTQTGFLLGQELVAYLPTKRPRRQLKIRDAIRKVAFGMNFAIVGIENQEMIDYSYPLRNMSYDVGAYEKQAAKIRKEVRKNGHDLSKGEYLYGFCKDSKLYPVVTFILYSGVEPWDGPKTLHEMLDFTDIPLELREMIPNYQINVIEIRQIQDISVFKTDVRQVFEFIRCAEDKEALKRLVDTDMYYNNMEEDAFDVVVQYTNATNLVTAKDYCRKDGKIDMCKAIMELIADGREEGIVVGREEGREEGLDTKTRIVVANMLKRGMLDEDIKALAECEQDLIDEIRNSQ